MLNKLKTYFLKKFFQLNGTSETKKSVFNIEDVTASTSSNPENYLQAIA
jgi:hypothetical protein